MILRRRDLDSWPLLSEALVVITASLLARMSSPKYLRTSSQTMVLLGQERFRPAFIKRKGLISLHRGAAAGGDSRGPPDRADIEPLS